jgi:hypothetical protein
MTDAYEREQMPGIGNVLLRRKVTSPRWIMAMMTGVPLGVGALTGLGLMLAEQAVFGLGAVGLGVTLSGVFSLMNIAFASARLVVSEGEFHLQLGMAGPRIPIEEIASVKLVRKRSKRRGMGVRNDLQGTTTYQLWGGNEAVHLEKRDGKKLVLVIQDAEPIVEALKLAMQRRDMPRVRVEGVAEEPPIAATNAASSESIEDDVAQQEQVRSQHH